MKRSLPWLVLILSALWVASNWRLPQVGPGEFDMTAFGKLPVIAGGRAKPLDTVARNSLVIIHGRQTIRQENGKPLNATPWLADMLFRESVANKYPAFVINNPEVLGLFGWQQTDKKFFSYNELLPFISKIDEQGQKADEVESAKRSPFQTAIYNLRNSMILYQRLKNSLQPEDADNFSGEIEFYTKTIAAGPGGIKNMPGAKGDEPAVPLEIGRASCRERV